MPELRAPPLLDRVAGAEPPLRREPETTARDAPERALPAPRTTVPPVVGEDDARADGADRPRDGVVADRAPCTTQLERAGAVAEGLARAEPADVPMTTLEGVDRRGAAPPPAVGAAPPSLAAATGSRTGLCTTAPVGPSAREALSPPESASRAGGGR